jgi:hypothetical protein
MPRRAFPIRLWRRSVQSLAKTRPRRLPQIAMRDLPGVDQHACIGAHLKLLYRATVQKRRPIHGRRKSARHRSATP